MSRQLAVNFINNSGLKATVSVGFLPGPPAAGEGALPFSIKNLKDGSEIDALDNSGGAYPCSGQWYTLDDLSAGVEVSSFSGRIYVCYDTPWTIQHQAYEPGQAVTDPNFFLRYDKMEMTFTGSPSDVADLTSIDYWSIPMTLTTSYAGKEVQTVRGLFENVTTKQLFDALNALTTPPVSGVAGPGGTDGVPLPALVPGQFVQYPGGPAPGADFARIIGPSSYPPCNPPPGGIPVMPYDTLQSYLQNLLTSFGPDTEIGANVPTLGNGVIASIAGSFAGVGPNAPLSGPLSRQTYALTASIDGKLDITLTGTLSGVSGTTTMLYKAADLMNPSGIYGGNTPYYLNGSATYTSPGNDVYGWVGGDLFSGLNIGAVGSMTTVGNVPGVNPPAMIGSLKSQLWFGIPPGFFFAEMQTSGKYYNQWAATLAPLSQAYNFAYSDRFAPVFANLNPATVDTLQITLEPGAVAAAM